MSKMNSVTMAAEQLGVSRQTVLRYIKIGKIKASRYFKEYRIEQDEIERLKSEK